MSMLPVPATILARFEAILEKRSVAPVHRTDYKKWLREKSSPFPEPGTSKSTSSTVPVQRPPWQRWEDGYPVKSDSPEWDTVIAKLAEEIKTRHYSRKPLETYAQRK